MTEKALEKIENILTETGRHSWIAGENAKEILKSLKELNYYQIEPDAELPDSPWAKQADNGDMHAQSRTSGYYCCQQDMLKANFRKVKGEIK